MWSYNKLCFQSTISVFVCVLYRKGNENCAFQIFRLRRQWTLSFLLNVIWYRRLNNAYFVFSLSMACFRENRFILSSTLCIRFDGTAMMQRNASRTHQSRSVYTHTRSLKASRQRPTPSAKEIQHVNADTPCFGTKKTRCIFYGWKQSAQRGLNFAAFQGGKYFSSLLCSACLSNWKMTILIKCKQYKLLYWTNCKLVWFRGKYMIYKIYK